MGLPHLFTGDALLGICYRAGAPLRLSWTEVNFMHLRLNIHSTLHPSGTVLKPGVGGWGEVTFALQDLLVEPEKQVTHTGKKKGIQGIALGALLRVF